MPELLENFMKMMCRIGEIGQITDIFNCYYEYWDKMNHILHAKLIYADDKAKEEKEAIKYNQGIWDIKTINKETNKIEFRF